VAVDTDREQIEKLERENEQLRTENKQLRTENERLWKLLEEALRKLHRQAGPFSRNKPKKDPKKPGRKPGDRGGQRGAPKPPDKPDEQHHAPLNPWCPDCGGAVEYDYTAEQWQQEIVRKILWRLFRVEVGHCTVCGRRCQGRHRLQTSDALGAAAVQIGPEALVLAAHMNKEAGLSHERIARVLWLSHGLQVSRSALCRAMERVGKKVEPTRQALVVHVRSSAEVWMDETGWRVAGALRWLWVAATREVSVYSVQAGRGFAQAAALIGADYAGSIHHDGAKAYDPFAHAEHQACLAHPIRRCRDLIEAAPNARAARFPTEVLALLRQAIEVRQRYEQGEISLSAMRAIATRLANGPLHELLCLPQRSATNLRLSNHLAKLSPYLFTFLRDPRCESTNNRAERELRPAVVNRKSWGGNRTDNGARTFERIASVLRTAYLQNKHPFPLLLPLLRARTPFVLDLIPDTS
jgi:transposase